MESAILDSRLRGNDDLIEIYASLGATFVLLRMTMRR